MSYLLYADDHEQMRLMVRDLLEASGHEVALAPDGPAALALLREREPDLLILDVSMPGMTGFEVCRAVKANPMTARIPVLMLTAEADIDAKVEGFESGADDYLAKPFDPRELRARVGALVRLVRREGDRNPTSGLPGSRAIDDELARRAARGQPFAVCYLDVDHFKPFNDVFGFAVADSVIRDAGVALQEAVATAGGTLGTEGDFAGHIGGDDFLLVTAPPRAERLVLEAQRAFRRLVERSVGPEVAARGRFTGLDRQGTLREFPLATLTAVVLQVDPARWRSSVDLGVRAADAKRRAKATGAGSILVERL
ncbi:response regulator [Roseisolibacter sp. H3M3-2]|uniref:GGDEF domain-containing response regulator n=1 Tax=Roseisolibacter sp. H3M3-2 TaxID=3031323 RepID=UPI0023DA4580|nr:response regulator [Roseisolibacter sp. H3M3-2]MDF1503257.1 response regulator [Roseisolibacter sp. H3M3-2]